MAFGQHQTFYLRQQWLTKGLIEIQKDSRFFYDPEHFEVLGVGKNMAKSIRYWLLATQLVKEQRTTQTEFVFTPIGELIFEKDLYTKNLFTLGLLHYLLVTEKNIATTWYWFFNVFNERVFTKDILFEKLQKWVSMNIEKAVSDNSLKKDIDCLLALYTEKNYANQTPEDVIKSPFEALILLKKNEGNEVVYMKQSASFDMLPDLLYVTLLKYCEKYAIIEVNLNELVNNEELWGKVFNLNRDQIIDYIDDIKERYPIVFTQTNNLDVLRVEHTNWIQSVNEIEVFS